MTCLVPHGGLLWLCVPGRQGSTWRGSDAGTFLRILGREFSALLAVADAGSACRRGGSSCCFALGLLGHRPLEPRLHIRLRCDNPPSALALFSIHISCMTLTCSSVYLFLLPLQRGCWRGGEEEVCVHVTVHGPCGRPSGATGSEGRGV